RAQEAATSKGEMLLYRPVWAAAPLPSSSGPLTGTLLLFSECANLPAEFAHHSLNVIRVQPGTAYSRSSDIISLRRNSLEDYEKLISEASPSFIIHNWAKPGISIQEALDSGIHSIHPLVRAAVKSKAPVRILVLHPPSNHPAFEAVAGYAKTV